MFKNALLTTVLLPCVTCLTAQDSTKAASFKISGSADVYYRYDFNNPKVAPYNNLTSFTNSQNSLQLGIRLLLRPSIVSGKWAW